MHYQLASLHDKRVKAEKLLEEVSATSQDVWELIKSRVEKGGADLTRAATATMKVGKVMAEPKGDDQIRQIALNSGKIKVAPSDGTRNAGTTASQAHTSAKPCAFADVA